MSMETNVGDRQHLKLEHLNVVVQDGKIQNKAFFLQSSFWEPMKGCDRNTLAFGDFYYLEVEHVLDN